MLALAQLDLVLLLGSDDPEAAEASSEARATFERLGAAPFLERLESALTERPVGVPSAAPLTVWRQYG